MTRSGIHPSDLAAPPRGARGWLAIVLWSLVLACLGIAQPARAAFNNTTPRGTFAGHHNYVVTGGSLRAQSNDGNACAVLSSDTATLSGIPAGSTIQAAYLYWGGSGPNPDANVTFAGTPITADDVFTDNFFVGGQYDLDYFGGFKDVTGMVAGNGNYSFGGLSVANTDNYSGNNLADYCAPQAVVAGWALVVVYSNPSERYRYSRVYDGLQYFRGSSVTTTQSGFRVPDLVDGKVTVVTWEGDPDANSSGSLDGFTEALSFDGNQLRNIGCDASSNIYNSTIGSPSGCSTTSYGVDIDTYNVTPYLYPGQTGATLEYSSGNDLVFLTAQVISTTNTPVADLGIEKTHSGNFSAGGNNDFSIVVHNYGPEIAVGTTTVTDVLPAGMTFVSGTGSGWSCNAVGQTVTCTSSITNLAVGANLPTLTLTVAVAPDAATSLQNTATVSHPMFDGTGGNQSSTDTVTVVRSNLSTSTKTVEDLDGGDALPGDTLRYTITLNETSGNPAAGVIVTDDIPANTTGFSVVSIPPGSVDSSLPTGGANGTGRLEVGGINLAGNGSASIVFDVTVATASPGTAIDNIATVTNPTGIGASPESDTVVVAESQVSPPVSGSKILYLYESGPELSRVPSPTTATTGTAVGNGDTVTWTLAPALAKELVIPAGTVSITLRVRKDCSGFLCFLVNPTLRAELWAGGTQLGVSAQRTVSSTSVVAESFNITLNSQQQIAAGVPLTLRVVNSGNTGARVYQYSGGRSTVSFLTTTVINIDEIGAYSAAYGSGTQPNQYHQGQTAYLRATVSDPFGSADITSASLQIKDPTGAIVQTIASMPVAASSPTPATRVFEFPFVVPANPRVGTWTFSVTANEGQEGTISHSRDGLFRVHGLLRVGKTWSGANAGDSVALTALGGSSQVPGSSTAPATTVQATATAAAGTTLILSESFTSGLAGYYTPSLACTRDKDSVAVPVTGTGLSRSIAMPNDSAVTCTWTNTWTIPLTVVKLSTVVSDPINGTSNPKAIPGAVVEYQIILTNPAPNPIDLDSVFVRDTVPANTRLRVADIAGAGSGPVSFTNGTPASGLTYTFASLASGADDIAFSNDGGATWSYVPVPDPDGYDAAVDAIRINPKGVFNANNAQFILKFRVQIL